MADAAAPDNDRLNSLLAVAIAVVAHFSVHPGWLAALLG
jgi:hypothetical protein